MKIVVRSISDKGCVRSHNEDMALVGHAHVRDGSAAFDAESVDSLVLPLAVADGMGGRAAGEVASEMVIDALDDFVSDLPDGLTSDVLVEKLNRWAVNTDKVIVMRGVAAGTEGMGTTLCGILFYGDKILLYNVGDSRIYRLRGGILRQLTTDHSMRELTGREDYPANVMYNCFGLGDKFFIDIKDITPNILPGDKIIICTDGLTEMLSDEDIESLPIDCASLVDAAKSGGGKDNVTLIIAEFGEMP